MSKFFVGQRVRTKTDGDITPHFLRMVGKEGTIVSGDPDFPDSWVVDIDGYGTKWFMPNRPCSWYEDHLEPLTPPHSPGSWEEIDKLLPNLRQHDAVTST